MAQKIISVLTRVLLIILFSASSAVFAFGRDSQKDNDKKNFLLIYTKIPNSERSRELFAGFSGYLSLRDTNSVITNFKPDPEGRSKNDTERIQILADVVVITDSDGDQLTCNIDSLLSSRVPVLLIETGESGGSLTHEVSTITSTLFFGENILLGTKLFPKTRNVIIVTDNNAIGQMEARVAKSQLEPYEDKINIHYLSPLTDDFNSFTDTLRTFPENSFIILSSWLTDSYGNYNFNGNFYPFISLLDKYPIFITNDRMLGSGVFGGYTTKWRETGARAAQIAERLKPGEIVRDTISDYRLLFDFEAVTRWSISLRNLPREAHLINRPPSIVDDYASEVIFISVLFFVLMASGLLISLYHLKYRRLTRESLNRSLEVINKNVFLNIALESAQSYTWSLNIMTGIYTYGENFERLTDYDTRDKDVLENFLPLVHPDDRERLSEYLSTVISQRVERFSVQFRMTKDQGRTYEWWERRGVTRIQNQTNDERNYIFGMDFGIEEHKEREIELIEQKLKAEEMDKLKTTFLTNMSHEIRTPLNGIVGFTSLLSDPSYSEKEKMEFSEIINKNAKMLSSLLTSILDLSRIESGSMAFVLEEFSLNNQINEILKEYTIAHDSKVKFSLSLPSKDVFVKTDLLRNRQILTNLINNALKFTHEGEVKITLETESDYAFVSVSDTGTGMTQEQLDNVFNRFYKVSEFVTGSGLGLSICKAITEKLGCNIWAESRQGKGSTFTYNIKLAPGSEHTVNTPSSSLNEFPAVGKELSPSVSRGRRPLILIAEDLESNYLFLKIVLSKKYDIIWAVDGLSAVKMFREYNPDIILMDIKMPVMDGIEATREIRAISPNVPIIAQTANAFEADHQRAYKAGCNDIITKPIKITNLTKVIEKYTTA
jgi:signal transduction histidine kinase